MTKRTKAEPKLAEAIQNHPFFRGFDPAFVGTVAREAHQYTFPTDEMIAREGTPSKGLYLVLEGKIALEVVAADHPQLTVQTIGPGEVFGWSWLVPPHHWRFDVRALKPSRVIALDGERLRRTLRENPEWGFQFLTRFMPVLAERLENTQIQLLDLHAR